MRFPLKPLMPLTTKAMRSNSAFITHTWQTELFITYSMVSPYITFTQGYRLSTSCTQPIFKKHTQHIFSTRLWWWVAQRSGQDKVLYIHKSGETIFSVQLQKRAGVFFSLLSFFLEGRGVSEPGPDRVYTSIFYHQ